MSTSFTPSRPSVEHVPEDPRHVRTHVTRKVKELGLQTKDGYSVREVDLRARSLRRETGWEVVRRKGKTRG